MPCYLKKESGEPEAKIKALYKILKNCTLCPRNCEVNRLEGEIGVCGASGELMVSSGFAHFGEEPPLVGFYGSGTIFLAHCGLRCQFCQNFDISHKGDGVVSNPDQLAEMMLVLQERGCHNINFVTPTHYAPQIVEGIAKAAKEGLELPIVWNCGGYESLEVLKFLDGVVDIYMPDVKFFNRAYAKKYCGAADYPDVVKEALKEMHRQVGDLVIDSRGIAQRGLLIRHLVMPNDVCDSEDILRFIAEKFSTNSYVNVMDQYRPCFKAYRFEEINRAVTEKEYEMAVKTAMRLRLTRGLCKPGL
ncbi:MAG: radical SAM protein [Nitrospinota bacterium]